MILSELSKCMNRCDFSAWAFSEQCRYSILCDIRLTRGSKCTNNGERIVIACFLRGHLNVHFLVLILLLVCFVRSSV